MVAQSRREIRLRRIFPVLSLAAAFAAIVCYQYHALLSNPEMIAIEEETSRYLLTTIDDNKLMEEVDSEAIRNAALSEEDIDEDDSHHERPPKLERVQPYNMLDAIREASIWESTFAVVVYEPERDKFVGLYSNKNQRLEPDKKLWRSMDSLVCMLRQVFPERFRGNKSDEFAIAIGSGDYPHLKLHQLPHKDGSAPVLQFGSAFRDRAVYPNMVAMPMPGWHLDCFEGWANQLRVPVRHVCGDYLPYFPGGIAQGHPNGRLVFGDDHGLEWNNLIRQVIWRGTDFSYLSTLQRPKQSQPLGNFIETRVKSNKEKVPTRRLHRKIMKEKRNVREISDANLLRWKQKKLAATQTLRSHYNLLLPRWKGAVITAESELEIELGHSNKELPWANIKFSRYMNQGIFPSTIGSEKYKEYNDVGIAVGKFMSGTDLAKYKYQIDIGGGGGTTWEGTVEKLAMPGLLFHHITPTKDYIHDRLEPWKHYIPVATDLTDLKEKFDWAESHPKEAQRIASQATDFMRHLGAPEGFGEMFEEEFVQPMRQIIDAYVPLSSSHPGMTWENILELSEASHMLPLVECSGEKNYLGFASCKTNEDEKYSHWTKMIKVGFSL